MTSPSLCHTGTLRLEGSDGQSSAPPGDNYSGYPEQRLERRSYSVYCSSWQPEHPSMQSAADCFPPSAFTGSPALAAVPQMQPPRAGSPPTHGDAAMAMAEMLYRTSSWPFNALVDQEEHAVSLPAASPSGAPVRCLSGVYHNVEWLFPRCCTHSAGSIPAGSKLRHAPF